MKVRYVVDYGLLCRIELGIDKDVARCLGVSLHGVVENVGEKGFVKMASFVSV